MLPLVIFLNDMNGLTNQKINLTKSNISFPWFIRFVLRSNKRDVCNFFNITHVTTFRLNT